MEKLTESTFDTIEIPFVWTIVSVVLVYAIGLPVYTTNTTSHAIHVTFAVLYSIWGVFLMVIMLCYLFRNILVVAHPLRTPIGAILGLLDFWFSLLIMQTAILYIPYMFDPVNSFSGTGVQNGPWYAWLQFSMTIASNFHGAVGGDVTPVAVFPLIWLTISSVLARLFMIFAVPIILRIIFTVTRIEPKKKKMHF